MTKAHNEVVELVREIRSRDYTVELDNQARCYKLYWHGSEVKDATGRITLPLHPGDPRWRKNLVARLVRAQVLAFDPRKADQVAKAKRTRPADVQATIERGRGMFVDGREETRQIRQDASAALKTRVEELLKTGVLKVDLVVAAGKLARENNLKAPNEDALRQDLYRLLKGRPIPPEHREIWGLALAAPVLLRPAPTTSAGIVRSELQRNDERGKQAEESAKLRSKLLEAMSAGGIRQIDLVRLAMQAGAEKGLAFMPKNEVAAVVALSALLKGQTASTQQRLVWQTALEALGVRPDAIEEARAEIETQIIVEINVSPLNDGGWQCNSCQRNHATLSAAKIHYARDHELHPCAVEGCEQQLPKTKMASHVLMAHESKHENGNLVPWEPELTKATVVKDVEPVARPNGHRMFPADVPVEMRALAIMCAGHTDAGLLAEALNVAREIASMRSSEIS